jgi:5-methylthioadenosine/S-adenosylhomocysteine deaminase
MNPKTTIISARWLIPIEPRNTVLYDHSVVIENDLIADICPHAVAIRRYPNSSIIERHQHVLMPGLINSHTHAAMCLFRGLADDLPLNTWLRDHIWPAETKWVDPEFVKDGTRLAIAEMLLSGTSCFTDGYFFPDEAAKVSQEIGIRATIGLPVLDFPSPWAKDADEYFEKGIEAHDEIRALSLIESAFAPHAPYTISDESLMKVRTYADELNVPIHMHVHETAHEVSEAVHADGKRPLQRLDDLGLLNPRLTAVHMTQLTDAEVELVAAQGVHTVYCPSSNAKLASGQCRVNDLLSAGANVCLGTDGAASNNNLDMFVEMRTAALAGKLQAGDASALPAWQVLEMATINGAAAVNQQHIIGSIKVGKAADLIAIDMNSVATQPIYDPISQVVYSASREQVSDVWVNGDRLLNNKVLRDIDLPRLLKKCAGWGSKILAADLGEEDE